MSQKLNRLFEVNSYTSPFFASSSNCFFSRPREPSQATVSVCFPGNKYNFLLIGDVLSIAVPSIAVNLVRLERNLSITVIARASFFGISYFGAKVVHAGELNMNSTTIVKIRPITNISSPQRANPSNV